MYSEISEKIGNYISEIQFNLLSDIDKHFIVFAVENSVVGTIEYLKNANIYHFYLEGIKFMQNKSKLHNGLNLAEIKKSVMEMLDSETEETIEQFYKDFDETEKNN